MNDGHNSAKKNVRNLENVREVFVSLAKFVNARTIYESNNPVKTALPS